MKEFFDSKGINYHVVNSTKGNILAKIVNLIYLLDYSTIYAAVIHKIDPSPVKSIDFIKSKLWFSKYNLSVKFYIFNLQYS